MWGIRWTKYCNSPRRESAMSRKPVTHWTIDELNKTVARKLETAKKYQPGPKRQKLLRDAKRYQNLLETKKWISSGLEPPTYRWVTVDDAQLAKLTIKRAYDKRRPRIKNSGL